MSENTIEVCGTWNVTINGISNFHENIGIQVSRIRINCFGHLSSFIEPTILFVP